MSTVTSPSASIVRPASPRAGLHPQSRYVIALVAVAAATLIAVVAIYALWPTSDSSSTSTRTVQSTTAAELTIRPRSRTPGRRPARRPRRQSSAATPPSTACRSHVLRAPPELSAPPRAARGAYCPTSTPTTRRLHSSLNPTVSLGRNWARTSTGSTPSAMRTGRSPAASGTGNGPSNSTTTPSSRVVTLANSQPTSLAHSSPRRAPSARAGCRSRC